MSLMLVKEDGTGKADANAYADAADGDTYHDGHLYATAWTAATLANKEKALVMATRLIDAEYQFNGVRANDAQGLQWPRDGANAEGGMQNEEVSSDSIPKAVVDATCEMARELLIADRTAAPAGEGLKYNNTGTTQVGYDKKDTRPIISQAAQAMLAKYGALLKARSCAVRLVRS